MSPDEASRTRTKNAHPHTIFKIKRLARKEVVCGPGAEDRTDRIVDAIQS